MAQAIWTGTISFGLVSVPVRLYPATRRLNVRFHELDRVTGQRLRHQRVRERAAPDGPPPAIEPPPPAALEPASPPRAAPPWQPTLGQPVAYADVLKGFEVAPRQYVAVSREELEEIAPERSRTIDIEQFVPAEAVDPIAFQSSYYLVPDRDAGRPFALLVDAMTQTERAGICWIVLRRRRHLALVRPRAQLMLLTTMLHADEVLSPRELPAAPAATLSKKERDLAALLVTTLSGPFEPERYRDEYRQRVKDLIAGRTPVEAAAAERSRVPDLMAALRASVEQARKQRASPSPRTAARKPATRRRRQTA